MTEKTEPAKESEKDLIDRIAAWYPADICADYYREMMYCRSLSENDELLHLLRILQFLTLLMEQIPSRIAAERETLEQLLLGVHKGLARTLERSETFQRQLDTKITQLPEKFAEGIKPAAIATRINESLNQQFVESTIPQTAQALGLIAKQMKETTSEFGAAASAIGNSYGGAAEEARNAVDNIHAAVRRALDAAGQAAHELSTRFRQSFRLMLYGLTALALVIGLVVGVLITRWAFTPEPEIIRVPVPVVQDELPVKPKSKRQR